MLCSYSVLFSAFQTTIYPSPCAVLSMSLFPYSFKLRKTRLCDNAQVSLPHLRAKMPLAGPWRLLPLEGLLLVGSWLFLDEFISLPFVVKLPFCVAPSSIGEFRKKELWSIIAGWDYGVMFGLVVLLNILGIRVSSGRQVLYDVV
ncbi:hypothetical protein Tco_0212726 [Tanacetum coccineum]